MRIVLSLDYLHVYGYCPSVAVAEEAIHPGQTPTSATPTFTSPPIPIHSHIPPPPPLLPPPGKNRIGEFKTNAYSRFRYCRHHGMYNTDVLDVLEMPGVGDTVMTYRMVIDQIRTDFRRY